MSLLSNFLLAINVGTLPKGFEWVADVVDAITTVLWPLLVVVSAAGMIYAIVLGVNMAKADSTEKREEAKKRLINVIIGMAITIGLILLFILFINVVLPNFFSDRDVGVPEAETIFKLLK